MMGYSKSIFKYDGRGNSLPILLRTVGSRIQQNSQENFCDKLLVYCFS